MISDSPAYFQTPNSFKLALCHLLLTVGYMWWLAPADDYIPVTNAFMMWRMVDDGGWGTGGVTQGETWCICHLSRHARSPAVSSYPLT